jgi:hypothetical protein
MAKKRTFGNQDIVTCIHAFASADGSANPGDVLRGDDPAVKQNELYFTRLGSTRDEIADRLRVIYSWRDHRDPLPEPVIVAQQPARLKAIGSMIAIENIGIGLGAKMADGTGEGVGVGMRLSVDDEIVKNNEDSFVATVVAKDIRDSLVAPADFVHTTDDDETFRVYAGQHIDRDHWAVKLHPHAGWALPHPDDLGNA